MASALHLFKEEIHNNFLTIINNYYNEELDVFEVRLQDFDPYQILETFMPMYTQFPIIFHQTYPITFDISEYSSLKEGYFSIIMLIVSDPKSNDALVLEAPFFYEKNFKFQNETLLDEEEESEES